MEEEDEVGVEEDLLVVPLGEKNRPQDDQDLVDDLTVAIRGGGGRRSGVAHVLLQELDEEDEELVVLRQDLATLNVSAEKVENGKSHVPDRGGLRVQLLTNPLEERRIEMLNNWEVRSNIGGKGR